MKTKFTLLTLLMLFVTSINFAQSSATASGIAIQGIARDNNNTARINTTVVLIFDLYFTNKITGAVDKIGAPQTKTLQTDNFGVFSTVLDPGAAANSIIANNQVFLKITEGGTTLSDEKLNHVPYAIAANNGVPTGSIMPFVGTTAPTGWVLCNGQSLAGVTGASDLIALIGNNAPDLRGMFLRGAGTNNVPDYTANVGPNLKERQQSANLSHTHANTFAINNGGAHEHNYYDIYVEYSAPSSFVDSSGNDAAGNRNQTRPTTGGGAHSHTISGGITADGGTESRPVNYGVNYIIKL